MEIREAYGSVDIGILLSLTDRAILFKANRENWQARKRPGRGGGREWLVSSMPQATQDAIRKAEERKAIEEESAKNTLPDALNGNTNLAALRPQTRQAILDDKRRYKALAKADLLDLYLDWQRKYGSTVAQKQAFIYAYQGGAWPKLLSELGIHISWKSIERWKLERKDAGTVLALADCRGLANRGKSMLTERHKSIILGQILDGDRQISTCARLIQARCQEEDIVIPSEETIRRFVAAYSKVCFGDWTLFRKGEKAWNDNCAISILRDWSLVEVGDVVIADGHTLNFETINPETGKPCRMTLLLFFDGRSSYPLGWEVMATENTACISSAFRRACIRLGMFPRVVYLDNGKAFRARFFQGCADFEQAGFLGLYRDLGCTVIHAWPYHGQSKPVERFFGTMHELEEMTPSYTGWNIDHKPARLHRNEKLHRALHEKLGRGPLTLEETHIWLARWFEMYASRPQHNTPHLKGKTPGEVFMAGRGQGVDLDKLTLLMLQKEIRTISKDGIRMFGRLYWSEELANRRHPVLVRYDLQLSPYTVLVYDLDGNQICEARDRHHYQIAAGMHPAASVLGTPEQKKALSENLEFKKGLEKEAKAGFNDVLGIILPEIKMKQQVALPKAKAIETSKPKLMTKAEIAAIEAAKTVALAEEKQTGYEPSLLRHWADEPARYEYLWNALYEEGAELVVEDAAFMEAFEQSRTYQANYKQLYEGKMELMNWRKGQEAVTA